MKTVQDKVAVITGAGSGIGRSIALALADAGTHVVVSDIQAQAAAAVAQDVTARGVRALAVPCDVAERDAVLALADRAYEAFGRVDILCNNAGVSWRPYRNIFDATLEDFDFVYRINVWGVLHGLKAFLPRMRAQDGEKHVVNTASLASLVPMEAHSAYCSSKAAVASFSEAIARELAPHGFGLTILCPGGVKTQLTESTLRLQQGTAVAQGRSFEPVAMPTHAQIDAFATADVASIGVMVRNAILSNTLYLHTNPIPYPMVTERIGTWFGPQTAGRA